uniref:hypothetical protein n=1 Tax=Xenorhabdus bovienii TaxID=40576 RepID=UPI00056E2CDB
MRHYVVFGGLRECHNHLLEKGNELTWLIKKSSLVSDDQWRHIQNTIIYEDGYSPEKLMAMLKGLHSVNPIHGLGAFHDEDQLLAIDISDALGLSFPNNRDTILSCQDKFVMRETLLNSGLPIVRHKKVTSTSDCSEFMKQNLLSMAVVKPTDGSGSQSVIVVHYNSLSEDLYSSSLKMLDFSLTLAHVNNHENSS